MFFSNLRRSIVSLPVLNNSNRVSQMFQFVGVSFFSSGDGGSNSRALNSVQVLGQPFQLLSVSP